jgi:hypothetical protein
MKKRWIILTLFVFMMTILLIFRISIFKKIGWFLVSEDPLETCDLYVVLGGNSSERGSAACGVHQVYPMTPFICTGGNEPSQLAAVGIHTYEAELTRKKMMQCGVDSTMITAINSGTSSKEEAHLVLDYCLEKGLKKITIISGQYHLRRLRMTYEEVFEYYPIEVKFYGAIEKDFNPDTWWTSESGLIYTNNEYIKILYYWWKY